MEVKIPEINVTIYFNVETVLKATIILAIAGFDIILNFS